MSTTTETSRTERGSILLILLLGGIGLFCGWRAFWFLADDAFIAFRYISNAQQGYGYVWNAPPFLPVEGYTSFLWVVLLDVAWRTLGIAPPTSANWVSLGFSYSTLLLGVAFVLRVLRSGRLASVRTTMVTLFVCFLVLNRTFLAWSSSGLESAMMIFFLLLWVYIMLGSGSASRRACLGAFAAVCLALTRPDGLLFCGATIVAVLLWAFTEREKPRRRHLLRCGLLPFCVIVIHQLWRVRFYGEWLPNTYYAKVTGTWPESGFRYLLSFTLEYAMWVPILIIGWALVRAATTKRNGFTAGCTPFVVVGAVLLHAGYYTYVVGGDHFEYRVYAHLVPLSMIALIGSLNSLRVGPGPAVAVTSAFLLLSLPVQWTHWVLTRDLNTRQETHVMRVPVAPHWPQPVQWYAHLFDQQQSWLIERHVCMRHQEHKVFWQAQMARWPSREQGQLLSGEDFPVVADWCVGVPSWVLPHVSVIDTFGLNDHLIARTPVPAGGKRFMAHSRLPPEGYVEGYHPNLQIRDRKIILEERTQALTSDDIAATERRWRNPTSH